MGRWPVPGRQFGFGPLESAVFVRIVGFSYAQGERIPRPLGACRKAGFVCAWAGQWSASVKAFRRQVGCDPQAILPAQRTGVAVERGGVPGIGGCPGQLLGETDRRSDFDKACGAAAVGEKTEMADTHEAQGQDVEQEAADELLAREGQVLVAVTVAVVLIVERTRAAQNTALGQGDAVAVAGQVIHHCLGVGETGLGAQPETRP